VYRLSGVSPAKHHDIRIVQYSQHIAVKANAAVLSHQITAILPLFATSQLISNAAQGLQLGDKVMVPTFRGGVTFSTLTLSMSTCTLYIYQFVYINYIFSCSRC